MEEQSSKPAARTATHRPKKSRRLFFQYVVVASALFATASAWTWMRLHHPDGVLLNRIAWSASYSERGQRVPMIGPREGFWGVRQRPIRKSDAFGWINTVMNLPGLLEVDYDGTQVFGSSHPKSFHILIVGASVAYGSDASSIATTYFAVLQRELERQGFDVTVRILATGGWLSKHELSVLDVIGFYYPQDLVIALDGMNDITQQPLDMPEDKKVSEYLANIQKMREVCDQHRCKFVVALQPSIVEKKSLTPLEKKIVAFSLSKVDGESLVRRCYESMRAGLTKMASKHEILFADFSRIFADEEKIIFADLWHFADEGHRRLGLGLASQVAPLVQDISKNKLEAKGKTTKSAGGKS